jgi:segregation and condensation protein A
MPAAFEVATPDFAGPMDLLVFLVRKRELDAGYISVSAIASDYLAWLDRVELPDLDHAGDFILLAATLLQFKASELLVGPEPEIAESEMLDAMREHSLAELLALRTTVGKLATRRAPDQFV